MRTENLQNLMGGDKNSRNTILYTKIKNDVTNNI